MSQTKEIREGFYLSDDGEWIPDGWDYDSVDSALILIGGGTPKTSIPEYWNGDIPWLSVVDFNNDSRWVKSTEKTITQNGLANSSTKLLEKENLIISARGTVGELAQLKKPMAFNQSCYGIKATEATDIDFFFYRLKLCINEFKRKSHGAVFDTITRETFKNISVGIPPLPEQKAIAAVLGSLDDKIELLRDQNETLETLAQTLFKRWFIDFNFPDQNGNPYKDNGGNMIPSELGEIPEGWRVGKLGEIINSSRNNVKTSDIKDDEKYVGLEHISKKHLQLTEWGNGSDVSSNKARFNLGDILFGKLRPYFHKVAIAPFDGICSTDILVLNPISENWFSYSLMQVYSERLIEFATLASTETRMPRASFDHLSSYLVVLPCNELADSFNEVCLPLFNKARTNTQQIQTLTNLRDTLLPKLMQGEIRIK